MSRRGWRPCCEPRKSSRRRRRWRSLCLWDAQIECGTQVECDGLTTMGPATPRPLTHSTCTLMGRATSSAHAGEAFCDIRSRGLRGADRDATQPEASKTEGRFSRSIRGYTVPPATTDKPARPRRSAHRSTRKRSPVTRRFRLSVACASSSRERQRAPRTWRASSS